VFGTFSFSVKVTDSVNAFAAGSFSMVIIPDIEPLRIISNGDLPNGNTGVDYSQQLFFAGGVGGPRTWNLASGSLPPGLDLGSASGVISGTPTRVGAYTFTVQLSDATPTTVTSQPIRITVTPGPLVILATGTLNRGTVAVPYSYTLQGKGGVTPYTWAKVTGNLPDGLTLNAASGVISGTPTLYGTFTFTVKLTDSQPLNVTSSTLTIVIDPAPLVVTTAGDLPAGKLNTDYSQQLGASGGKTPYTWALAPGSGPLPGGLTLNASTGVISGKPTATGLFSFVVKVTDATPVSATSSTINITVTP
jgi:hypothetical protein